MWSSGGSQQLFGKGVELNNELKNGDSILLLWGTIILLAQITAKY